MAETVFVTKDAFDIQIKGIRDREDSDEKISDIRFDYLREMMNEQFKRLEAVVEKNLARHEAIAADMKSEVADIRSEVKTLQSQIASKEDIGEVRGDVKALAAQNSAMQNRFSWNLAWVAIVIGLVLTIVQRFWK